MTTPKAHVALSRFLDLTKSAQMTVPKGQNDRTKSGGPYQKRNENAMTVPNVRGSHKNLQRTMKIYTAGPVNCPVDTKPPGVREAPLFVFEVQVQFDLLAKPFHVRLEYTRSQLKATLPC